MLAAEDEVAKITGDLASCNTNLTNTTAADNAKIDDLNTPVDDLNTPVECEGSRKVYCSVQAAPH